MKLQSLARNDSGTGGMHANGHHSDRRGRLMGSRPVRLAEPVGTSVCRSRSPATLDEHPVEESIMHRSISSSLQRCRDAQEAPPISPEELDSNLSELERNLNRDMVCFAGKNQVYIQSIILGGGRTSKPRIALKCRLRKQLCSPPDVYYEYIRDVCCGDPSACPAHHQFRAGQSK